MDLKWRSGPIVVKIEYSIPENNVEAFLDQMRERRRVQSRVGARHWNLQRESAGAVALDRDIPHADLDGLPSPEPSPHSGGQGTGSASPRIACGRGSTSHQAFN
ncbi:hypothetical protein BQ8482_130060 [Mesorhizobium delmotii]|uniref:Uncharacterized protein n=1 Tax=Mesorhizobium delmotii TaxID=1631247 RepID=A0A2P9AGA4_9HYPH|nr:hypothetical protein BQ8482_130060 [Mesorhizobium delmotii]